MKALRILSRSIRDSFKSVFRNLPLSMASILCTTITLILVAIAIFLSYNVREVTTTLEHELTIVVYLKKEVTEEEKIEIQNDLKTMDNVDNYKLKTKEEWKAEMKKESDTLNTTLDYLEENPLLDSVIVTVKDVKDLKATAERLRDYDYVSSAEYGEGMVENIIGIFDAISYGTIIMVVALVCVTAFLIANTIKLTIFSRKTEIEIMRLVGASNTAIKLPFVFEGFILGVLGSLIPIALSIYGYTILYSQTGGYVFTKIITLVKPFPFVLYVSLILLGIGSVVGMLGSWWAVRKHLKI
jgi:cell division transport system permease protein